MASLGKHAMIYTTAHKLAVRADVLGLLVGRLIQNRLLREPRRKQSTSVTRTCARPRDDGDVQTVPRS